MNDVIRCDNVSIQMGSHRILSGLDLSIEHNQFVGIFGPNGAGKTTFMKAVLGMISIKGSLKVFNETARKARHKIGYVPQHRDLSYFQLTGRNFIATSIQGHIPGILWLTKAQHMEIDKVLELVHATELAKVPLSEMSGGQRQRLLLAQALIGNPKLLILDEPFSNLDPKWVKVMLSLIKTIQQQYQLTVLLSTHDLNPLLSIIDKVLCVGNQNAILGKIDDVVTSSVLSDLYGFALEVIKTKQHIFITTSS